MTRKVTPEIVREAQRLCVREGLSIAGAARLLGVNVSTLRNYSRGRRCVDCGDPIDVSSCTGRCQPCHKVYQASPEGRLAATKWTRERIVAAMRDWAARYGEPPAGKDWDP